MNEVRRATADQRQALMRYQHIGDPGYWGTIRYNKTHCTSRGTFGRKQYRCGRMKGHDGIHVNYGRGPGGYADNTFRPMYVWEGNTYFDTSKFPALTFTTVSQTVLNK
jgi:hypothetical protein